MDWVRRSNNKSGRSNKNEFVRRRSSYEYSDLVSNKVENYFDLLIRKWKMIAQQQEKTKEKNRIACRHRNNDEWNTENDIEWKNQRTKREKLVMEICISWVHGVTWSICKCLYILLLFFRWSKNEINLYPNPKWNL